jgi:hypothetical protein
MREADRPDRSALLRTTVVGELGEAIPGGGPLVLSHGVPKETGRIRKEVTRRRQDGLEGK